MCFFANFWGDFVIVNAFSVLLFCEYLFANGRNDIWSSRGSWMWAVAIQIWSEQVWLLSGLRSNRFADAHNDYFSVIVSMAKSASSEEKRLMLYIGKINRKKTRDFSSLFYLMHYLWIRFQFDEEVPLLIRTFIIWGCFVSRKIRG